MKKPVCTLLTLIFVLTSHAQASKAEKARYAAWQDSTVTAEMISRRTTDDSTNLTLLDCPVLGTSLSTIHIIKTISQNAAIYHVDLMTQGSTLFVGWKGAVILFTDGTKMKKPDAEIDIEVSDNGFRYSTIIELKMSDLKILSSKTIGKFRLNVFDGELNSRDAEMFRLYVKNIVKLK